MHSNVAGVMSTKHGALVCFIALLTTSSNSRRATSKLPVASKYLATLNAMNSGTQIIVPGSSSHVCTGALVEGTDCLLNALARRMAFNDTTVPLGVESVIGRSQVAQVELSFT